MHSHVSGSATLATLTHTHTPKPNAKDWRMRRCCDDCHSIRTMTAQSVRCVSVNRAFIQLATKSAYRPNPSFRRTREQHLQPNALRPLHVEQTVRPNITCRRIVAKFRTFLLALYEIIISHCNYSCMRADMHSSRHNRACCLSVLLDRLLFAVRQWSTWASTLRRDLLVIRWNRRHVINCNDDCYYKSFCMHNK